MTQRERLAPGGAADAALPPVGGPAAPPPPGPAADAAAPPAPRWEEVFRHASPEQRQQLLTLARHQGLLYSHQLPAAANGTAPAAEPARQQLLRLLAGHAEDLEPVRPQPVAGCDPALDPDQRDAVARALVSPDVFLLRGLPGTGKSRVVAEILAQAAARGERVLLLAPTAAAVDRALELVGGRDEVCAVRCLGPGESPETLPPYARALTFAERVRHLREQPLQLARRERDAAEELAARLRGAEPAFDRLREIAGRQEEITRQAEAVRRQSAQLTAEVEREAADPAATGDLARFHRAHQKRLAALDETLAGLRQRQAERAREAEGLASQWESLDRLRQAKKRWRVWTGAWWRALTTPNLSRQVDELEARRKQIGDDLAALEHDARRLEDERHQAEQAFAAERRRRVAAEVARRREQLEAQEAALGEEQRLLQQKWQAACQDLGDGCPRPAELTPAAVRDAQTAWRQWCGEADRRLAFAREWVAYLEQNADRLAERLVRHTNLVAATTGGLPPDPHFGDGSTAGPFDLLVLQEADRVTKSEFLALARRARRWVLVGEPEWAGDAADGPPAPAPGLTALRPGFFHGLWRTLHCDPRDLPYAWDREGNRLVCRLRPVAADQRRWLETERVADCPEVELRILAAPRARPALAEVVFPPSYSIARAKAYLYRELEELPAWGCGTCLRWREEPARVVLEVGAPAPPDAVAVELEAGVREIVSPDARPRPWATSRFEFDCAAGWQRPRAEEWAANHLGLRDLGRTAVLDVPHRMTPELAAFVSDLLFAGEYRLPARSVEADRNGAACARHGQAAVEFVTTAPYRNGREPARAPRRPAERTPRPSPPRTGAGLELDLADRRHRDRLPSEYRDGLPERGYVNYLEARLVVRTLESLAATPCTCRGGECPAVAVIALYPAQAALIRRLVRESRALAATPLALEVGVPGDFRQRECPVVVVSLTRSHSHRAVSFGEGPGQLALALTRARHRLILVGDAGTLARRGQWEGAVDHLDAAASARERELIGRLVGYLEGAGAHPAAFLLREGSGG